MSKRKSIRFILETPQICNQEYGLHNRLKEWCNQRRQEIHKLNRQKNNLLVVVE